jgi:hypothetical protein
MDFKKANTFKDNPNEKWDWCYLCGKPNHLCVLYFDSGSTLPIKGETITGATTGDTGVVEKVYLTSGSWSGGDAEGVIILENPTGWTSEDHVMFDEDELLNGSTAGNNFSTVKHDSSVSVTGRKYPDGNLIEEDGRKYCRDHYKYRYHFKHLDDKDQSIADESERNT